MNQIHKKLIACGIALTLSFTSLNLASAQTGPTINNNSKVIVLEGGVIEGKIEKPQVFYLLERHKIRFERLKMKKSFLDEILKTVRNNPF